MELSKKPQNLLLVLLLTFFAMTSSLLSYAQEAEKEIIEIKIYHLKWAEQEKQIDEFLEKSYLPAVNRAGIKLAGVFKPIKEDSAYGKKVYVIVPYASIDNWSKISQTLNNDQTFAEKGNEFLNATHDKPPYERIETILLKAFDGMPYLKASELTNTKSRIYELRSYESATENLLINKVKMFNEGEIEIFDRLNFNPVFYGEVLVGSNMPNLMYMIGFPNKESREGYWNRFIKDAGWEEMRVKKEYQNNVSHIDSILLEPTAYSKI